MNLTEEEMGRIRELASTMALRAIAKRMGRDVKTIRAVLGRPPRPPQPSKLEPFQELIRDLAAKELTAMRIWRQIRERGYAGSLTILKEFLRQVRGPRKCARQVFARFETPPGIEAQCDWSPYRVPIAGRPAAAHCFSMIAAHSRYQFISFYRNERLPTLLHAHREAFLFFDGVFRHVLYDNMTAVTLGRSGGRPIWNPTFLEFAKHFGFEPRVCRPRDPNRKGKVERPFRFIEEDFLKAREFSSWEDLNEQARRWLDTVANARLHGTTKQVPRQLFLTEETPVLIRLPAMAFMTDRREVRKVQTDGTISLDGSFYGVPAHLVGQYVTVLVDPHRVRVLDAGGQVLIAHAIPDRPMRVASPGQALGAVPPSETRSGLESRFLARFPQARDFLDGLKLRMNALAPVHLRKIEKLVELYGAGRVHQALERAQGYRNFNAVALERILQAAHPDVVEEPPWETLTADPSALGALDGVESGSPQDYALDRLPPTPMRGENDHGFEDE